VGSGGALSGEISHREFLGSIIRYAVRVGGTDVTIDAPFVTGDNLFADGDRVEVTLPSERTLWLAK
jgi:iron(III) transport system ATP-binding protein